MFCTTFVIQLPEVCSYQAIEYTVVVWENGPASGGNLVLQVNGTCNKNCSRKKINLFSLGHSSLMTHRYYWIMVEASTGAGMWQIEQYSNVLIYCASVCGI